MKVAWIPCYSPPANFASSRLRVWYPHSTLLRCGAVDSRLGFDSEVDVLFVQKVLSKDLIERIRTQFRGRHVIWDFDDPVYESPVLLDMVELASLVTTDTPGRKEQFDRLVGTRPCKVWEDGIDYAPAHPCAPNPEARGAVWFGNHPNFGSARWMLEHAREAGHITGVISQASEVASLVGDGTDVIQWQYDEFVPALRRYAVAVLSHEGSDRRVKSNNKAIAAIAHGVPCIVSESDAYTELLRDHGLERYIVRRGDDVGELVRELSDLDARTAYLQKCQESVWKRYNASAVASRFVDLAADLIAGPASPRTRRLNVSSSVATVVEQTAPLVPVFRPSCDIGAALSRLEAVLRSGWVGLGPATAEFELAVAARLHCPTFVYLNSCTSALHLAIHCLDLPRGSKVLTTPITFVSTNSVLLHAGLVPVFCDVEARTGNLDASVLEEALGQDDIRAILLVHMAGYPCDLPVINRVAAARGVPVVEDCAHAFGARIGGVPIGSGPNTCAWSFHAVKNLTTGEGGGLSTHDRVLEARFRRLRWLGIDRTTHERTQGAGGYNWEYDVHECGFKYHGNDLLAAIGLANIEHVEAHNARRRQIAETYMNRIHTATPPSYVPERETAAHFLPLFFKNRDAVHAALRQAGVQSSVHYRASYRYAPFRHLMRVRGCVAADWYEAHELTLPIYPDLSEESVERIVAIVNAVGQPA